MFSTNRAKSFCIVISLAALNLFIAGCIDFGSKTRKAASPAGPESAPTWSENVAPLLMQNCAPCHTNRSDGGLNLAAYESAVASERIIMPGEPDSSELIKRIEGISLPRMPLGGTPLTDDKVQAIRDWIADGALDN